MSYVASAIVNGGQDYREQSLGSFADRLAMLRALVAHLTAHSPHAPQALLLPAGYFCALTESRVEPLAQEATAALSELQPPFTVVFGIDGWTELSKTQLKCSPEGYPFFVYVLRAGQGEPLRFRQLGIGAREADDADGRWGSRPACCEEGVGLLICGESWGDPLLRRVESVKPTVLLIPAHWKVNLRRDRKGMGRMSWHLRLEAFHRRTGIPVVLSEHTRSPLRHDYAWGAKSVTLLDLPDPLSSLFTVRLVEV